jgi:hypothetical protein
MITIQQVRKIVCREARLSASEAAVIADNDFMKFYKIRTNEDVVRAVADLLVYRDGIE